MEYRKDFYPDAAEAHPRKNLEPLGEPVTVWVYVDENHEGNLANSSTYSCIIIYVNKVLINLYSIRYNTVESSSFGLEFVALLIFTEMVEALR